MKDRERKRKRKKNVHVCGCVFYGLLHIHEYIHICMSGTARVTSAVIKSEAVGSDLVFRTFYYT